MKTYDYNDFDEYEDDEPQREGPQPDDYEDYSDFVEAVIDYKLNNATPAGIENGGISKEDLREGIAQGMKQALASPMTMEQRIDEQSPDNELADARQKAIDWIEECKHNEQRAKQAGNLGNARAWAERMQWGIREIQDMGPSEAEKYKEEALDYADQTAIQNKLLNPANAYSPVWDSPKMEHDAKVVIARANQKSKGKIVLPMEDAPFGNVLRIAPQNMTQVELSPSQVEKFKREVYDSGGPASRGDSTAIFRKAWDVLRKMGMASNAKPVIETDEDPETTQNPSRMSQKRFEANRQAEEDRKRGGPKKGFVFPKRK